MSVQSHNMRWTPEGDPVFVVEAVGVHDVYRLCNHLERGQCEFAAIGRRGNRGLRRKLVPSQWQWLMRYMHGDGGYS